MENESKDEKNTDEQTDVSSINSSQYSTTSKQKSFLSKILLVPFSKAKKTKNDGLKPFEIYKFATKLDIFLMIIGSISG